MNKFRFILASLVVILLLDGCELFTTSIEYHVTGPSSSISVLFMDRGGRLEEVEAASPWSESLTIMNGDRPFMAYLRVTNSDASSTGLTVYIDVDGTQERTASVAYSATGELYFIVE
jgi:hypothetical protein